MKTLTMGLALALTALTLNMLQADSQPQQGPRTQQPRLKIAQGTTTPAAKTTQKAQPAAQTAPQADDSDDNDNDNDDQQQPESGIESTPSTPGSLPVPKTNGNSYMITQRTPMQNPNAEPAKPTETITITEVTTNDPAFTQLATALKASGLLTTLKGNGPYTLFAPNDKAFAKLSPNAWSDLLRPENKDKLVNLLSNHIVAGKITAGSLKTSKLKTLSGQTLDVKVTDQGTTINHAKIEKGPINAANGTIYIVDTVLQP